MKWLTSILSNVKLRRLVADAVHLIHLARQTKSRADAIAKDPDRAFKQVIRVAAAAAGVKVSEREVDLIHLEVARVLMGEATDQWKRNLAELDRMFERTAGKI